MTDAGDIPTEDLSKVIVTGDGLKGGKVNQYVHIFIDVQPAAIPYDRGFGIQLTVLDSNGSDDSISSYAYEYAPFTTDYYYKVDKPGYYTISLKDRKGRPCATSPWTAYFIKEDSLFTAITDNSNSNLDPSKVVVSGDGLTGGIVNQEVHFFIDASKAVPPGYEGDLGMDIHIEDGDGNEVEKEYDSDHRNYTMDVYYTVSKPGDYIVSVKDSNGTQCGKSPWTPVFRREAGLLSLGSFRAEYKTDSPDSSNFIDPSKVVVTGNGLEGGNVNQEVHFFIDASKAVKPWYHGDLGMDISILDMHNSDQWVQITSYDHRDYTMDVYYHVVKEGDYIITVNDNKDEPCKNSPWTASFKKKFGVMSIVKSDASSDNEHVDPSKVVVSGNGLQGGYINHSVYIHMDASKAVKDGYDGDRGMEFSIKDSDGNDQPIKSVSYDHRNYTADVLYCVSKPGDYTISLKDNKNHPCGGSPWTASFRKKNFLESLSSVGKPRAQKDGSPRNGHAKVDGIRHLALFPPIVNNNGALEHDGDGSASLSKRKDINEDTSAVVGIYLEMGDLQGKGVEMRASAYLFNAEFWMRSGCLGSSYNAVGVSLTETNDENSLLFTGTTKESMDAIETRKIHKYMNSDGFFLMWFAKEEVWSDMEKLAAAMNDIVKINDLSSRGTVKICRSLINAFGGIHEGGFNIDVNTEDGLKLWLKTLLKEQWHRGDKKVPDFNKSDAEVAAVLDPILDKAWELWNAAKPEE
jgi:hypothetical protein